MKRLLHGSQNQQTNVSVKSKIKLSKITKESRQTEGYFTSSNASPWQQQQQQDMAEKKKKKHYKNGRPISS